MPEHESTTALNRHVLVVAHAWYGDVVGGAFRLASEFAEDLAAAGYDVDYVCCAPAELDGRPERERINGVTVYRYPALRRRSWPVGRLRHHVRETERLVNRLAGAHVYAAVSGHSPLQSRGAFQAMRRLQPRAYLNYTVHSPFDDELSANAQRRLTGRPMAGVAGRIDRRNLAMADRVQTCSQYTLNVLQRKHPRQVADKGRVVPGWVNSVRFSSDRLADCTDCRPRAPGRTPLFFTLRRLEARMGLETLIDASALLRDWGFRFQVVIGGNGSLRESLERRVREYGLADRVEFIGRVTEPDLPLRYAAADCFVLPTRALECFGLIVLEAYAAGTPVIASRAAAIPELADRQGLGWDFDPGDAPGLARRMAAFINGELRPSVDLRRIAAEFDRAALFPQWHALLHPEMCPGPPDALPNSNRFQTLESIGANAAER